MTWFWWVDWYVMMWYAILGVMGLILAGLFLYAMLGSEE